MEFDYWYLAPLATLIATLAMASGIGGAVFFAPLFIIGLELDPAVAVGAALITELFGFGSGLFAYVRKRLIDYRLGLNLVLFSVPAAVLGSWGADLVPGNILKAVFSVGIIFIGVQLYRSYRAEQREQMDEEIERESLKVFESEVVARDGTRYHYTICERAQGRAFAAIGGVFLGMISVGLAELQEYQLVARCKVPSPVAVATSVFVVVITVLFASLGHIYHFASGADPAVTSQVLGVVTFTIPGVIIGGQLGPTIQSRLDPDVTKVGISALFVAVGIFMLYTLR